MRIVRIALGAAVVATSLSGCEFWIMDPALHSPMAIRTDGDALVVMPCEKLVADDILMETRGPATSEDWQAFYIASGSIPIRVGVEISTARDAPVLDHTSLRTTPRLPSGTEISILFADNTEPFDTSRNSFEIGDEGVPEDAWLQWDGTVTDEPCEYVQGQER